jgi:hypothetical protein
MSTPEETRELVLTQALEELKQKAADVLEDRELVIKGYRNLALMLMFLRIESL